MQPKEQGSDAQQQVRKLVEVELQQAGIELGSPAAENYLFKVFAYGFMGAQPPMPELGTKRIRGK